MASKYSFQFTRNILATILAASWCITPSCIFTQCSLALVPSHWDPLGFETALAQLGAASLWPSSVSFGHGARHHLDRALRHLGPSPVASLAPCAAAFWPNLGPTLPLQSPIHVPKLHIFCRGSRRTSFFPYVSNKRYWYGAVIMLWYLWWELVPNSQNILVIYRNVWKLMEPLLDIAWKRMVSYLSNLFQILFGFTLFCTRLHTIPLGTIFSAWIPKFSLSSTLFHFLWSQLLGSTLLLSHTAWLWRFVT